MNAIGNVLGSLQLPEVEKQIEARQVKLPWIVLPPQAQVDIDVRGRLGQKYAISVPESPLRNVCQNCRGLESIWVRFITGGPFQSIPQFHRPETATWMNGAWYRVESKYYPCPACSDPNSRIPYLFERSGLEPGERAWRVDFIKEMAGKETALREAHMILHQAPRPTGLHVFYGDYGRGKSGLGKSLVAQMILAGVSAAYIPAADLLKEIRSTFSDKTQLVESEVVDRFSDYQLLVIDEVDRVSLTSWAQSTLMAVLDRRYSRRETHCTLLLTNLDPDYLPAGFEYLQSRMKDGNRILIGGKELRG